MGAIETCAKKNVIINNNQVVHITANVVLSKICFGVKTELIIWFIRPVYCNIAFVTLLIQFSIISAISSNQYFDKLDGILRHSVVSADVTVVINIRHFFVDNFAQCLFVIDLMRRNIINTIIMSMTYSICLLVKTHI